MGIKKGTKLTDAPKSKTLKVRIDAETDRKLEAVCARSAMTKSDVVRRGIELQHDELTRKE